jgi:hypothetical protein
MNEASVVLRQGTNGSLTIVPAGLRVVVLRVLRRGGRVEAAIELRTCLFRGRLSRRQYGQATKNKEKQHADYKSPQGNVCMCMQKLPMSFFYDFAWIF